MTAILVAACGASSKPKAANTSSGSATSSPSGSSSTSGSGSSSTSGGASSTSGPVHATLQGENHSPVANANWTYTVRVTDASGHPLDGTVDTEFTVAGTVVGHETPPTHALKNGVLHDVITYPKASISEPVVLQVVVHTSKGSVTLDWPVSVRA